MHPDFPLAPRTALRWGVWLLLGLLLALGVRALTRDGPAENPAYDALSKAHTRRMAADSVALAQAKDSLERNREKTLRAIVRIKEIRDTLNIHDTVQVKVFVARADSVVRACSELAESCDRFRVRAESSLVNLTLDRDRWKLDAEAARKRSWVREALPYIAFVGGIWIGSKATR